uniref:Triple gene block 1 n=1 Tax=Hibiscus chlorotic speck associated virus 3 TaxID=3143944 RepID=A0AAU7L1X9_9VIRU
MKMNNIVEILENFNFQRTNKPWSEPLVVHGVPGSGKTSLVNKLIELDTSLTAFSGGSAVHNFSGTAIHRRGNSLAGDVDILDEYPIFLDSALSPKKLILCDPFQHKNRVEVAHFISFKTHRFGNETCAILSIFGLHIETELVDRVILGCCYKEEPEGKIVAFEKDICDLLRRHNIAYSEPEEILGSNCDKVTFYTSTEDLKREHPEFWKFYVCLTRHRTQLKILSPYATFTPCRSF